MTLITLEARRVLLNKTLPENSLSIFKRQSCYSFLNGDAFSGTSPSDTDIAEFRLAVLECIDQNPLLARSIRFDVLCTITENHFLKQFSAQQNLYAEILASDLSLMDVYDEYYASLVVLATIHEQLSLLQILKNNNAAMHEVIPDKIFAQDPNSVFHFVVAGETAAHAYLRRVTQRGPFYFHFDLTTAIHMMDILLSKYTIQQMQGLKEFAAQNLDASDLALQIINATEAQARLEMAERILTFVAPRNNPKMKVNPELRNLLNCSGDNSIARNVYSFLKPQL